MRLSLGAGRWRLVRQLLVESLMLSTIGAAAGLLIARWGSRAMVAHAVDAHAGRRGQPRDGLARVRVHHRGRRDHRPAVRRRAGVSRHGADAGRRAARSLARRRQPAAAASRSGHALVALQVALSFVLVFGSTLFVRTLVALTTQDMGFEPSHVLVGNLDRARAPASRRRIACRCSRACARRVAAVPGVEAAATSFVTPVSGSTWNLEINVPGYAANERRGVLFNGVSPDFFKAMGTPLLAGRDIADTRSPRRAERDHRQRSVREEVFQRRESGRQDASRSSASTRPSRPRRWRSSAWSPTPSISGCARRRSRRCTAPSRRSAQIFSGARVVDPHRRRAVRFAQRDRAGDHRRAQGHRRRSQAARRRSRRQCAAGAAGRHAVRLLRRAGAAARRARPLRRDVVHRHAAAQRDRHPHGARRGAAQGDRPRAHERRADHDRRPDRRRRGVGRHRPLHQHAALQSRRQRSRR